MRDARSSSGTKSLSNLTRTKLLFLSFYYVSLIHIKGYSFITDNDNLSNQLLIFFQSRLLLVGTFNMFDFHGLNF